MPWPALGNNTCGVADQMRRAEPRGGKNFLNPADTWPNQ
jgi:hypothetical protein